MAAENGRRKRNNRATGTAASGADINDPAIRELIDGAGSGAPDGESANVGDTSDGSESESGIGGTESAGSGDDGGISATESGRNAKDRGGNASGNDSGGTRNRSRSAGRSSERGAASEETRKNSDSVSRETVKPKAPKAPKLDADIPVSGNNKEIIGDVFQFVFWGIGQATGLREWELDTDDALTIGENGDKWLKSLGPKRAKSVVNGLKKIGPSVAFFGSLGMALVPRVKLTIASAKDGAIRPLQERKTSGNSPDSAPVGDPPIAPSSSPDGATGINARSFTAADFGEATQGHVGEDAGGFVN